MKTIRKALLWLAAGLVCIWVILLIGATVLTRANSGREWPEKLGPIVDVAKRFPDRRTSLAAFELIRLSAPLGVNVKPREKGPTEPSAMGPYDAVSSKVSDYLRAQLERPGDALDAPPREIEQFLVANDAAISAVRDHLLRGQPLVWSSHIADGMGMKVPNLLGHMQLFRILVTRAIRSAQRGDAAGWDDLHASWILSRSLWDRADLISILIALAGARMVNAAAAKMPGSEPAWLAEMRTFDYRRAMASSYQAETWMVYRSVYTSGFSADWEAGSLVDRLEYAATLPYQRLCAADYMELMRRKTISMVAVRDCDLRPSSGKPTRATIMPAEWNVIAKIVMPNLLGAWQRQARFQAELEGTERILQIKRGETPRAESRCTDGKWQIGGTPRLKFSRDIAVSIGTKYPLAY